MAYDQYTILCILAVLSALMIIAAIKFVRYKFRNEAKVNGERRRRPVVRRLISLLPVLPVALLLFIGVKVGIDLHNQSVAPPTNIAETAFAKAVKGDAAAQADLGGFYANGHAVIKDESEAYFWYSLAATAGNIDAATKAAALADLLSPEQKIAQKNRLKAFKASEKAQ